MKGFNEVEVSIELPESAYKRLVQIAKKRKISVKRLMSQLSNEIAVEVFEDLSPLEQYAGKKLAKHMKQQGETVDISEYLGRLMVEYIESYDAESEAA